MSRSLHPSSPAAFVAEDLSPGYPPVVESRVRERVEAGAEVGTFKVIEGTGEAITCLVVFGPPGSLHLLGATALENFGVQADPTAQKLRPITAVIATAQAGRTDP